MNTRDNKDIRMKAASVHINDTGDRKANLAHQNYDNDTAYAFATPDETNNSVNYRRPVKNNQDFSKLQTQLVKGSAKLCHICGGVMKKKTRRILSWLHGAALAVIGILLMGFYGWATHFYQAPWVIKFALPAVYYIGSIFIGVGILFFFIRENVWKCIDCREISKR